MSVKLALYGFKTVLASINPSPELEPENIYVWPFDFVSADNPESEEDQPEIDLDTFPFVIVEQVVNRFATVRPQTHGTFYHSWLARLSFCLAPGPALRNEVAAIAQYKHEAWLVAIAKLLDNNRSLNDTVFAIGDQNNLYSYRVGNIGWSQTKSFWGIVVEIPVLENHSRS